MSSPSFQRRIGVITAMPADPRIGSGCSVAILNLTRGLEALGVHIELIRPNGSIPNFTLRRIVFNERLRFADLSRFDATIGIDVDGYARSRRPPPHIANIKGVLGDATRFESGWTRRSMEFQARLEARHVRRADKVITTSWHCAGALRRYYDFTGPVAVVPEAIDLEQWRELFLDHGGPPDPDRFTVLCVCRFYPRKRVDILLRAAALARKRAPELRVRIVGDGPAKSRWLLLGKELGLDSVVEWLGAISRSQLARELTMAHAFCLPSVQEGFGIVFLEAMAARLPIVAARNAAVPEVIPHALLCPPDDVQSFADALLDLYRSRSLRLRLAAAGAQQVERYDLAVVSESFLREIVSLTGGAF